MVCPVVIHLGKHGVADRDLVALPWSLQQVELSEMRTGIENWNTLMAAHLVLLVTSKSWGTSITWQRAVHFSF